MSIVHIAFYPSDWLAGTRGLSAEETGVYITLVCRMYEMAGPIERDDARLARLCGCKTKNSFLKSLNYLISDGKITESNGELFNDRAQEEIEKVIGKSSKARAAAEARWSKKSNKNNIGKNADASLEHMPQSCQSEPESDKDTNVSFLPENDPPPEPEKKRPKRKSRIREDAEISDSMLAAADKRGHSKQEAEAQFQRFKNDALAKGKQFVDWDRAYVTWLDSEYFRPITSTNGQTAASGEVPEQNYELWASAIKENKDYLIRNISRQRIGEMIDRGFITEDLARERRLI